MASFADFSGATVDIAIWSNVEMGLAIAAGSLATLRPLVRMVLRRVGLSSSGGDYNPYAGNTTNSGLRSRPKTKTRNTVNDINSNEFYPMDAMGGHKSHAWSEIKDPAIESPSALKVTTETQVTVSRVSALGMPGGSRKKNEDDDTESQEGLRTEESNENLKGETAAVPVSFLRK